MKKIVLLFTMMILIPNFVQAQKFDIVFNADVKYASDQTWITQIKTWGATGVNLRVHRHILENNYQNINNTEWNKVKTALNLIKLNGLKAYVRVNMVRNPNSGVVYSDDDYQQSEIGLLTSSYYGTNVLNISSSKSFSDRIWFFSTIVDSLNNLSNKDNIQLIVPTISQDDETEYMFNKRGEEGNYLTGYSSHSQTKFKEYLYSKYGNTLNLNKVWDPDITNINSIDIKMYNWDDPDNSFVNEEGRKDFLDFLSSELKRFIDTCATIVHDKGFNFGITLGSIYDGLVTLRGTYDLTPLVENVDLVCCNDIIEYKDNFKYSADYLRSVCNYWNWRRIREGSTLGNMRFATESNWPGYNHYFPSTLVTNWKEQLSTYYNRGATTLFISHWGTESSDHVVKWYNPDTTYTVAEIIKQNNLDSYNYQIRNTSYSTWKTTLNNYKTYNIKYIPFPANGSVLHFSPLVVLYSKTNGIDFTHHTHNDPILYGYLFTNDGLSISYNRLKKFPIFEYLKPQNIYTNQSYYNSVANDFVTDYMIENSWEYLNEFNSLNLTSSSYFLSDEVYKIIMAKNLENKSITLVNGWNDNGHNEFALTPGLKNEYNNYRSPIQIIWRTRSDLRSYFPNADNDAFIFWARTNGTGDPDENYREYPEWEVISTYNGVNKYNYDKNIRDVWEKRSDLRSVFIDGHSNSSGTWNIISWAKSYGYLEEPLLSGYNNWPFVGDWLSKKTIGGSTEPESSDLKPNLIRLEQNYPNPFNPYTKIRYSLPEKSFVTLKIYDILGVEIITLVKSLQYEGNYEFEFNGSDLTSGIYFYNLQANNFTLTKKMILMK